MSTVMSYYGMSTPRPEQPHPMVVGVGRVGIEVELENVNRVVDAGRHWDCVSDNSLRNGGYEFVTRGRGLGGRNLHEALSSLEGALKEIDLDDGWRCSTHVHVDAREMTVQQVKNFILIYTTFERVLFRLSGWKRLKNNFCTALCYAEDCVNVLTRAWRYENTSFFDSITSNWSKYTSLNLLPLCGFGTIEVRISEAKWRRGHLLKLVNRLLAIKELAINWEGDYDSLVQYCSQRSVVDMFPKGLPRSFAANPRDILDSSIIAYDIINRDKFRRNSSSALIDRYKAQMLDTVDYDFDEEQIDSINSLDNTSFDDIRDCSEISVHDAAVVYYHTGCFRYLDDPNSMVEAYNEMNSADYRY